jgi:branched-chain amino acid transport system permease protein
MKRVHLLLALTVLIPLVSIGAFVRNIYYLHLFNLMIIYSLFSLGLNILTGFTGITSFGHAGFFAVGAYVTAILTTRIGLPVLPSVIVAAFATGLVGFLVSLPVIRISGIYLAMVTLGFAEFVRLLAINWEAVTGGPLGISRIPPISLFRIQLRDERLLFLFLYPFLLACTVLFVRIVRSRLGQSLRAIKDSESAAASIGIPCARNKMISFFISGFYSGIAGALYAHLDRFISPDTFGFDLSILVLCMVVVGGMGSVVGSILGAVILVVLLEIFQPLGDYRLIVYGGLLMIMITYFPEGLVGIVSYAARKVFRRGQARPAGII